MDSNKYASEPPRRKGGAGGGASGTKQDGLTRGGTLESGTSVKEGFHGDGPASLGQHAVGPSQKSEGGFDRPRMKGNKPGANPVHECSDGVHKIR